MPESARAFFSLILTPAFGISRPLQEAILSYNERYREKWNFDALKAYIRVGGTSISSMFCSI